MRTLAWMGFGWLVSGCTLPPTSLPGTHLIEQGGLLSGQLAYTQIAASRMGTVRAAATSESDVAREPDRAGPCVQSNEADGVTPPTEVCHLDGQVAWVQRVPGEPRLGWALLAYAGRTVTAGVGATLSAEAVRTERHRLVAVGGVGSLWLQGGVAYAFRPSPSVRLFVMPTGGHAVGQRMVGGALGTTYSRSRFFMSLQAGWSRRWAYDGYAPVDYRYDAWFSALTIGFRLDEIRPTVSSATR